MSFIIIYDDDVIAVIRYPYTQHHLVVGERTEYTGALMGDIRWLFLFLFVTFIVNKKNLPTGSTPQGCHTHDRPRSVTRSTYDPSPLCKLYVSCESNKGQAIKNDGIVNRFELTVSMVSIPRRSKRGLREYCRLIKIAIKNVFNEIVY